MEFFSVIWQKNKAIAALEKPRSWHRWCRVLVDVTLWHRWRWQCSWSINDITHLVWYYLHLNASEQDTWWLQHLSSWILICFKFSAVLEKHTSVVLPALQEILKLDQVIQVVNQVIQVIDQVIQVVNQVIQVVSQWCVFLDISCLIWGFSWTENCLYWDWWVVLDPILHFSPWL